MISLQDQILTEMNHQEFNSIHQLLSIYILMSNITFTVITYYVWGKCNTYNIIIKPLSALSGILVSLVDIVGNSCCVKRS